MERKQKKIVDYKSAITLFCPIPSFPTTTPFFIKMIESLFSVLRVNHYFCSIIAHNQAIYHSGETYHLVWSRMLDDWSERGKYSREDRNENAEKNQGGDSERQNEEWRYQKRAGGREYKSKARESRLRWFGHVHRREQESNLRQVMDIEIPGRRPRGRPRGRWRDLVNRDMRELRVVPEDADDRNLWRRRITTVPPTPPRDKVQEVRSDK